MIHKFFSTLNLLFIYRATNNGTRVQCVRNTRKTRQLSVPDSNEVPEKTRISVGMPIIVKRNARRRVPEIVTIIRRVVRTFVRVVVRDPVPGGRIVPHANI